MPWPHNLYLEIAAETGLVGLAAGFVVALAGIHLIATRAREHGIRRVHVPTATLMVLLVFGLVEVTLLRLWVWSLAAMALGWLRNYSDSTNEN